MSRASFTIAYDGPALSGGVMDVRDLAPALMALGQLLDAANVTVNGDTAQLKLQVRATAPGSFQISFDLVQSWTTQVLHFFASDQVAGATNLLAWVLGVGAPATGSLLWLTKKLRGGTPVRVEQLSSNMMRLTFEEETFDIPLELLRLYQDLSVRNALQKLIQEPLKQEGIDEFQVKVDGIVIEKITEIDATYFSKPVLQDEILIDELRSSAFSIVSLAFKEDNKWRLFDGNTQISASISDSDFLAKVDTNQLAFSKGDILMCEVRVVQRRTIDGLKTDYIVERVVEHRPAARQLPLPLVSTPLSP